MLGYYTPAFFHINVGTNASFRRFYDLDYSVYLHEYMHFIQDTTTLYGLNNMFVYSEYIRYAINSIYDSIDKRFNIPILPTEDNKGNVYLNMKINKLTNGDSSEIKRIKEIVSINPFIESTGVVNSLVDEIESISVECIDNDNNSHILSFGALSIMENMAYMMEQLICSNYVSSPDYPYSFVEKIAEKIYPEFCCDRLNVLALCDLTLQYSNPGRVFVQFLQEMHSEKWLPVSPEELYDVIYLKKNSINNKDEISFEQCFVNLTNTVKKQIKGYFYDPQLFTNISIWVDQLLNTAINLRFKNKYFILNIARGGNVKTNKPIEQLFKEIGTPLISNNSGECIMSCPNYPDGADLSYFSAIGQIISIFESKNCACSLYPMCVRYKNEVDERCKSAPWERCNDKILCPVALLWRHWKLKDYIPIV
jgi:hypothetical protein